MINIKKLTYLFCSLVSNNVDSSVKSDSSISTKASTVKRNQQNKTKKNLVKINNKKKVKFNIVKKIDEQRMKKLILSQDTLDKKNKNNISIALKQCNIEQALKRFGETIHKNHLSEEKKRKQEAIRKKQEAIEAEKKRKAKEEVERAEAKMAEEKRIAEAKAKALKAKIAIEKRKAKKESKKTMIISGTATLVGLIGGAFIGIPSSIVYGIYMFGTFSFGQGVFKSKSVVNKIICTLGVVGTCVALAYGGPKTKFFKETFDIEDTDEEKGKSDEKKYKTEFFPEQTQLFDLFKDKK